MNVPLILVLLKVVLMLKSLSHKSKLLSFMMGGCCPSTQAKLLLRLPLLHLSTFVGDYSAYTLEAYLRICLRKPSRDASVLREFPKNHKYALLSRISIATLSGLAAFTR